MRSLRQAIIHECFDHGWTRTHRSGVDRGTMALHNISFFVCVSHWCVSSFGCTVVELLPHNGLFLPCDLARMDSHCGIHMSKYLPYVSFSRPFSSLEPKRWSIGIPFKPGLVRCHTHLIPLHCLLSSDDTFIQCRFTPFVYWIPKCLVSLCALLRPVIGSIPFHER